MKVVSLLDGTEIETESILAIYTGPVHGLSDDAPQQPDIFENAIQDRILPKDLVLHEVNLLQVGFTFWIKIDAASGNGPVWVPVKMVS